VAATLVVKLAKQDGQECWLRANTTSKEKS